MTPTHFSRFTPIYPELGRPLSPKDIGQSIVRVRPFFDGKCLAFDFIPKRVEEAAATAFILMQFDDSGMTVLHGGRAQRIGKDEALSPIYLTLTEFKSQIIFARVVKFNHDFGCVKEGIRLHERTVWPNIGRAIFPFDIGKKVVRTYPSDIDEKYDYSLVPYDIRTPAREDSSDTLIAITEKEGLFETRGFRYASIADNNYLTVEEFLNKAPTAKSEVHVLGQGQLIEIRK